MSRTWLVWTETPVRSEEMHAFAEAEGGYWIETAGGEAVIERGEARLFIGVIERAEEAIPDDLKLATAQLGRAPESMLSFRIGYAASSRDLAEEIATRVLSRWRGFVDRNEPS